MKLYASGSEAVKKEATLHIMGLVKNQNEIAKGMPDFLVITIDFILA